MDRTYIPVRDKLERGTSPVVQWLRIHLPVQRMPVEKLRYLHRAAKPGHLMKIQQSQKDKTGEKEEIDVPHPPLSSLLLPYFLISLPLCPHH